jgi:hypothetical protein
VFGRLVQLIMSSKVIGGDLSDLSVMYSKSVCVNGCLGQDVDGIGIGIGIGIVVVFNKVLLARWGGCLTTCLSNDLCAVRVALSMST